MTFGVALEAAKRGKRIARTGWNGRNQYVELATNISYMNGQACVVNANHLCIGNKALAFVGTSGVQLGWLASQADMLADDWIVYADKEKANISVMLDNLFCETHLDYKERQSLKKMFQDLLMMVEVSENYKDSDPNQSLIEISGALKILRLLGKLTDEQEDDIWVLATEIEDGKYNP